MTPSHQNLVVHVDSGEALDVREFTAEARMSSLFEVAVVARSENANIDFDAIVGRPASFRVFGGASAHVPIRFWTGICKHFQQVAVEETGLSTYHLTIVPTLWLATQRRNHRIFQQISELDIVRNLLAEWGIEPVLRIAGTYKKREYRVQYAESDFAFLSRMLEDAGISFYFEQGDAETRLVLSDAPEAGDLRPPIAFRDNPTAADREHVTEVRVGQHVRPGRYTLRDHDTRLPASYPLVASAAAPNAGVEGRLERFHYVPGAFLFGADQGEDTPFADDKGKSRSDENEARALAGKRLDAKRADAKVFAFETNVADLSPGVVMSILDHPRSDVAEGRRLLVVESALHGTVEGEQTHRCEARRADLPFRPPLSTPKPKVIGVESATVVGSAGEEIHTDEFGRVRVHFHWDRESVMNDNSSCWIPVSQPWGGAGYGGSNLPRVGQEVLVDFLGGDPDRPVIVGRIYTNLQKTPYKLPDNKTQSGWRSNSSPQTGGYNELMFEDGAGKELVRMQAEKDLTKLVKHDEAVTIGNDRAKQVGRDDGHDVGRDRRRTVGRDESVDVGKNRRRSVGEDELVTIGKNRTRSVGEDEVVTIGKNRTRTVGKDETIHVGENRTKNVSMSEFASIGQNLLKQVALSERETTGLNRSVSVGVNRSTQVGAIDSTMVGDTYSVSVSPPGEGDGPCACHVIKNQYILLDTGAGATITMEGDRITIRAAEVCIEGTKDASITAVDGTAQLVSVNANVSVCALKGSTAVKGKQGVVVESAAGTTSIQGETGANMVANSGEIVINGPMVKIN